MKLIKPGVSLTIRQGHPLAQGLVGCFLVNESGTGVRDYVSQTLVPAVGGAVKIPTAFGLGLDSSVGNDAGATFGPVPLNMVSNSHVISFLWRGLIKPFPAHQTSMINIPNDNTGAGTNPFWWASLGFGNVTTPNNSWKLFWSNGGALASIPDTANLRPFDGTERQVVGVIASGFQAIYEDANGFNLAGVSSQATGFSHLATAPISIGLYNPGAGINSNIVTRHAYVWNRIVTPEEVKELFFNPYGFLADPDSGRQWFRTRGVVVGSSPPPPTPGAVAWTVWGR